MNHNQVAKQIVAAVGGKGNISAVAHCMTRLRFTLKDSSIPNKEEVQNIDGVISVVEQGGQFQVVIGNQVAKVHKEVTGMLNINSLEQENSQGMKKKQRPFEMFTSTISGIFVPVLGALAAAGMLKGLLTILLITDVLTEKSGTYIVLFAISNTFFYFMPILIGASSANYFKLNIYVGMIIGGALMYPTLIPFATEGSLTFLSLPVNMMDYTSSIFPAIVAVWFASKVNNVSNKFVPESVKFFLTPMIVLIISIPIALMIIGPAITFLSNILADIVSAVYNFSPILAALVIGGPWIILVMFGLHWAFIPIFINNIATQGYDPVMGLLLANQFAMAGAALAVGFKTKQQKLKALSIPTGVTCLLGVSEPALYGVLLPYKKPLIASIIGGSLGAVLAGAFLTKQFAFGASGFFSIPLIIDKAGIDSGFYGGVASQFAGLIIAFVITYVWGFKKTDDVPLSK
ncbi:PTS transporter subunit EIIC [Peribacillus sp. NPDC096379]|uniref:PTS transporter subunit EIIC n=1 Tax=Peribacillus sp. NPDC096379 TaxID=3364393 RepID=UPI0038002879